MTTSSSPSLLFTPFTIRRTTFRNRLWVSPMCMYSARDGVPQEWHHTHLTQFASGGAGLIVAEATAVVPEGRISPRDTGLWNDAQRDAWKPIVDAIHDRGALVGVQLAHAGRKASTWWPFAGRGHGSVPAEEGGWPTVAPSAVAFEGMAEPGALDAAGIERVVDGFRDSARRALEAGFDALEVHGAHGYLLHEFLSPLSNRREDEYGGSLENRARLLLRVVEEVRAVAGETPLFVRISATDHAEGGFSPEEAAVVGEWAIARGADLIDVSSGGLVAHQRIAVGPGYQVPFAAGIRRGGRVPTTAVGLIDTGAQAEQVLAEGSADAIFVGRGWLRDPHLGLRAAHELGAEIDYWPPQYLRARWH